MREGVRGKRGLAIPGWWATTGSKRDEGWWSGRWTGEWGDREGQEEACLSNQGTLTVLRLKSRGNIGRVGDSGPPHTMRCLWWTTKQSSQTRTLGNMSEVTPAWSYHLMQEFSKLEPEIQEKHLILLWPCHGSNYKDIRLGVPTWTQVNLAKGKNVWVLKNKEPLRFGPRGFQRIAKTKSQNLWSSVTLLVLNCLPYYNLTITWSRDFLESLYPQCLDHRFLNKCLWNITIYIYKRKEQWFSNYVQIAYEREEAMLYRTASDRPVPQTHITK